jgi:hypothetical protein
MSEGQRRASSPDSSLTGFEDTLAGHQMQSGFPPQQPQFHVYDDETQPPTQHQPQPEHQRMAQRRETHNTDLDLSTSTRTDTGYTDKVIRVTSSESNSTTPLYQQRIIANEDYVLDASSHSQHSNNNSHHAGIGNLNKVSTSAYRCSYNWPVVAVPPAEPQLPPPPPPPPIGRSRS